MCTRLRLYDVHFAIYAKSAVGCTVKRGTETAHTPNTINTMFISYDDDDNNNNT